MQLQDWSLGFTDDVAITLAPRRRPSDEYGAASRDLVNRIVPNVPIGIEPIVQVAILIGHRRRHVHDLARVCGTAPRTIHWRLATAGPMTARQLLAWALALHAAWRRERLGWNVKQVSAAAGFDTRGAFANYIRRNVWMTPGQLSAPGTVDLLTNQFIAHIGGEHRRGTRLTGR